MELNFSSAEVWRLAAFFRIGWVIWHLVHMCEEDPQPLTVHAFMCAIPNMILANRNSKQLNDAKEHSKVFADN